MPDLIDELFETSEAVLAILDSQKELSLRNDVENQLRKALALSSASMFESEIKNLLEDFCDSVSAGDIRLVSLVKAKVLDRGYHMLFDWDRKNANSFFSLFGETFKASAEADVRGDNDLEASIRAFLELGRLRNELVHRNYATYLFDQTSAEVLELHRRARGFVSYLKEKILEAPDGEPSESAAI